MARRVDLLAPYFDEAELEAIRLVELRTQAALERHVTERLFGRTAESTARYWEAMGAAARLQWREPWPPFPRAPPPPERAEDEEPRPRAEYAMGEGEEGGGSVVRIQEDEAAAKADAARIGGEEDGLTVRALA